MREVEALEQGLARLPESNVLQLRYEDLVADPTATLTGIGEFCGLPSGRNWRRALSHVRLPNNNDKWRDRLGDSADLVEGLQAGWLRKYGYLT